MDQAVTAPQSTEPAAQTYRLTPAARRTLVALLLGVAAIALYALWTIVSLATGGLAGADWVTAALMLVILVLSPAVAWSLLAELTATITTDATGLTFRAIGGVNLPYRWTQVAGTVPVPTGLGRLPFGDKARSAGRTAESESAMADSQETTDTTLGDIPVTGVAEEIGSVPAAPADPAAETSADDGSVLLLAVDPPAYAGIANPLVRLLYRQAYGGGLPLYPGLAGRAALLARLSR